MNELVCNYAAIRFLPYRETGEFVNIGVVVYCPEIDFFDFKLAETRNRRVRAFFPELDKKVYQAAVCAIEKELNRSRNVQRLLTEGRTVAPEDVSRGLTAFRVMLRRRETLVHFADPGMILADPTGAASSLFDRYVNRSFARPREYQEAVMGKRLNQWLKEWNLKAHYLVNQKIGNDEFHVRLPFVHMLQGRAVKALKPLDLDKVETTEIYEHGDAWVQKMYRLRTIGQMTGEAIFAVRLPVGDSKRRAADEICEALRGLDAKVVPFEDSDQLKRMAQI